MDKFRLDGKVALVTGTNKGMGKAIALELARVGAKVVGIVRTEGSQTKAEMLEKGYDYTELEFDLSNTRGIEEITKRAIAVYGSIEILVNNAGVIKIDPAEVHSIKDYDYVMDVNTKAVFLLCQSVGKHMLDRGYGKIINTSSIHGIGGGFDCISYTASKHAVIGITKALSNEWAARGINVNAIAPGYTITDNTKGLREKTDLVENITNSIAKKRWAVPEDIAPVVVFLASPASDYITGQVIRIDGGIE
ncbi:SDR family NAD(P)-dependent oxidoreductase [Microaceticoccus formicicus]|uniref:SDR family NAD(P)-dependent oxidoreductase n=1 Tax=Microaceticoccus formicicus TaxID=3118105 RepID=UPI003CCFFCF0|nr:SDR family oxidoreductase [Peptoniphilaceae bacterium AMB_02]